MPLLREAGPALRRLPGWEARLAAFLRDRRDRPYQYGVTDCGSFAIASVRDLTGTDLAPGVDLPGSAIAAGRFLLANGVRTVEELFAGMLGPSWPHLRQARRGDLVSFWAADETHMALVTGLDAVTPGPSGLLPVPPGLWRRAWKVG